MPDNDLIKFNYGEVAEALVKHRGIHEGLWGLVIEFALGAASIRPAPDSTDLLPVAIIPVQSIGLNRASVASNLTVDAALVNPLPKPLAAAKRRRLTAKRPVDRR